MSRRLHPSSRHARPLKRRAFAWPLALALGACAAFLPGCFAFHAGPLPGAPDDARYVVIDGTRVRFVDVGEGPVVVLVHGFASSLETWAGVIPPLSASHRVLALDLKGFGWTDRPEGDYSPEAQARLVLGLMDARGVTRATLVGHSYGGGVVLAAALAAPSRVERIALYDAWAFASQLPAFFHVARADGLGEAAFAAWYGERAEDRLALAFYDESFVSLELVEAVEAALRRPGTYAAALAAVRAMHYEALEPRYREVAVPALLLWGREDHVTTLETGERLAQALPGARLVVYPRCGHFPMIEHAAQSTAELLRFLDEEAGAAPSASAVGAEVASPLTSGGGGFAVSSGGRRVARGAVLVGALAGTLVVALVCGPQVARAQGTFAQTGDDLRRHDDPDDFAVELEGYLRVRGEVLHNFDLDRGVTPSGDPLFPVPLDDPDGQALYEGDLRLRTDSSIYAPGGVVAVHARLDVLDNLTLGSTPNDIPSATTGQRALDTAVHVRRAWAEVLTPFGLLAAGRMGNAWGLGMLANGGDCLDCDGGDAADRVAFLTPLAGHVWAVAFDWSASGPSARRASGFRAVDVSSLDDVRTVTVAAMNVLGDGPRARRHRAGRVTVEYGAYVSHRWQERDVPAWYLATATPVLPSAAQSVPRDLTATVGDVWLRVEHRDFRVELEAALLASRIAQTSLVPGALLRDPITALQIGAALETDFLPRDGDFSFGLDAGFASGDPAPGFGAFPRSSAAPPAPGDLDGVQASLPYDTSVDNFRFHPDYRIDRILFREILGTVTDAIYARPHLRARVFDAPFGRLTAHLFGVASFAVEPTSTPSGEQPLGIELDPSLVYEVREGFVAALEYAVLFPLAGLDNPYEGLAAQPAQLLRLRLQYVY